MHSKGFSLIEVVASVTILFLIADLFVNFTGFYNKALSRITNNSEIDDLALIIINEIEEGIKCSQYCTCEDIDNIYKLDDKKIAKKLIMIKRTNYSYPYLLVLKKNDYNYELHRVYFKEYTYGKQKKYSICGDNFVCDSINFIEIKQNENLFEINLEIEINKNKKEYQRLIFNEEVNS
ncbi:MAG TPA: hypothetical protein DEF85_06845 [Clostridiaceae bacterium]|jgi:hypothetical protein|nr:hypothetical protein [Clostridiaceae bacterium]HBN29552.1 hypothetical protein [Clostridiaceae bacterium]HBX48590.1 hypothetical protein [Clostridiaceae bacterium]HCL51277.1 hypothetical protein [Clostridiaceae bacterium]